MRVNLKHINILIIGILILSFIRIYITYGRPISAMGFNVHDDSLFVTLASTIVAKNWLGTYNSLTLAKNPFYPIFLSLNHFIRLPLILSQNLLYIFSGILLILTLKKIIKNDLCLIILYAFYIFNPMVFNFFSNRVLREGIYMSLSSILITGFIYINLIAHKFSWKNIFISLLTGIFLSAFWLTKEDGEWIIPSILFLNIFWFIKFIKTKNKDIFLLVLVLVPYFVLLLVCTLISSINYFKYGSFVTSELKSGPFLSFYGALNRVDVNKFDFYIPVSKKSREKIYNFVPEFRELDFAESDIYPQWSNYNNYCLKDIKYCGEVSGGFFMWAIRGAVDRKNYYINAKTVNNYYKNLASKINYACNSGLIKCLRNKNNLQPYYKVDYIKPLIKMFITSSVFTYKFENFNVHIIQSSGSEHTLSLFRWLTNNDLLINYNEFYNDLYNQRQERVLSNIGFFYQQLFPYLFYLSFLFFIVSMVYNLNNKILFNNNLLLISMTLFIAIITRILMLSLVEITSFNAINSQYLSPVYPLLITFVIINIYAFVKIIKVRSISS